MVWIRPTERGNPFEVDLLQKFESCPPKTRITDLFNTSALINSNLYNKRNYENKKTNKKSTNEIAWQHQLFYENYNAVNGTYPIGYSWDSE